MYSAGVLVPQGYHITVANSFSPGDLVPGGGGGGGGGGGTRFEGVPNHRDTGYAELCSILTPR